MAHSLMICVCHTDGYNSLSTLRVLHGHWYCRAFSWFVVELRATHAVHTKALHLINQGAIL